jgi:hypothetical protein
MRFSERQLATVLGVAMGLFAPGARAQVQVAPETVLRLTADASVGYVKSSAQGGLNSINFGLGADLNGYYYHPNFLQFQFSPYYNKGREYSTADFVSGDKGFSSSLNLFGGSNIPLFISYSKSKTSSGLFGLVGSESSVVGEGTSDNLNINWNVRLERLPSFQVGYFRNGGDYRIFGDNASEGRSSSNGYVVGSQYNLFGFALGASYTSQRLEQLVPRVFLTGKQQSLTSTDQNNLRFTLNRQLSESTFFDLTAGRTRYVTDATGQSQNRRYDIVQGGLSARPVPRMSTTFRFNYVSDLNALLLGSILPGSGSNSATNPLLLVPVEARSRYLTYSAAGNYNITPEMGIQSSFRHGTGRFSGRADTGDTAWNNTVNYQRKLLGGRLATSYSMGIYDFENGGSGTSSQAHSGTVTFIKAARGWQHSGAFQMSNSQIDGLLPGHLSVLSTEFSSTGMVKGWRLLGSFRYETTDSIFNTETENRSRLFRVNLSRSSLNIGASIQSASGLSILTIGGVRPATAVQAVAAGSEFERLLIPISSSSYTFTASYQLSRRTAMNGSWTRTNYTTLQTGQERENSFNQVDFHIRHWFRQLDCRAGFRHYDQRLPSANGLYRANTVYFQVSRHFDVF